MKKTILSVILMLGITAANAEVYIGGGVGQTKYNFDNANDSQNAMDYYVNGGYIFDNGLGIEGEIQRVESANITNNVKTDYNYNYTVYGVGRVRLDKANDNTPVNLVAKLGGGYSDLTLKSGGNQDSNGTFYPAVAAGLEFGITEAIAVTAGVDYKVYNYSFNNNEASVNPIGFKAGIQYKF